MRARESRWVRLAVTVLAAAVMAGHPSTSARQQGNITWEGTPPVINGAGQTDWASHNLDVYNHRFSELDQIPFGALSGNEVTTGDLVFQATEDGGFYAFDAPIGEHLFYCNAELTVRSSSLTHEVNGTLYVAVIARDTVLALPLP